MLKKNDNFRIIIDRSIKVGQLPEIARTTPITRTPHVGNLNPVELALLTLGIPLRLVDKNCSVIDNLFHPEAKIIHQKLEVLSSQHGVLAPFLQDDSGNALAHLHIATTRKAVPGFRTSSYSLDYLAEIDRVIPVLETLALTTPEMFNRLTTEGGGVVPQFAVDDTYAYYGDPDLNVIRIDRKSLATRAIRYFEQVAYTLEQGKTATGSGYTLLKADADIILQGVIDTSSESSHGIRRFFQCCGIPMARYIADPRMDKSGTISRVYRDLQRRLGNLPSVEMILLPISHLRFAYMSEESLELHQKINQADTELKRLKNAKSDEIKQASSKQERDEVVGKYQLLFQQVKAQQKNCIDQLANGRFPPFYVLGSPQRFTQYDLAASSNTIQIPEDVMEMSLKSLSIRLKKLLAHHPKKKAAIFN